MKSLSIGQHFPKISLWELIFHHSRASNSKAKFQSGPNSNFAEMPVLVTCKYDEDPIKIEGTIDRTMSNMGFFHSMARNSKVDSPFWLDF